MTPPGAHSFTNHRWNQVGLVQNDRLDRARGVKVPPRGVCRGGGARPTAMHGVVLTREAYGMLSAGESNQWAHGHARAQLCLVCHEPVLVRHTHRVVAL